MIEPNQNFYYIIPAILAEGGKPQKALLYGLITSLTRKDGICTATNDYLAKKLGKKHIGTISNLVRDLENDGWIETMLIDNFRREIRLNIGMCRLTKNRKGGYEKTEGGDYEKTQDSIITDSNINSISVAKATTPADEMFDFTINTEKQGMVIDMLLSKGIQRSKAEMEVKKFISYWTEPTRSGKKQRWETEKTFELKRRLATWFMNVNKFSGQKEKKTFGDIMK